MYVIATSAPPVLRLAGLVEQLRARNWKTCVIATPTAASWIDVNALSEASGYPVRVHPRAPHDQDPLPPADAVLAAPLTFNSLNKWAHGHSDTLALGLLNEALGLDLPIVAAPCVKQALRSHPAYGASIATLEDCRVRFLDPETITVRTVELVTFDWSMVVSLALPGC
jgi:phosphopantothenoylcysteine decarboxylase